MAKTVKYELDQQEFLDYYEELLSETAVMMWETRHTAFTFAFYLNHLYGLHLVRRDSVTVFKKNVPLACAVYSHHDSVNHQQFFLIENSMEGMQRFRELSYFDKLLLATGPDARERLRCIYDEMYQPARTATGIVEAQRESMRRSFIDNGIVQCADFDFSDPDSPATTFLPYAAPDTPQYRKQQKYLEFQKEYIEDLLVQLDPYMAE